MGVCVCSNGCLPMYIHYMYMCAYVQDIGEHQGHSQSHFTLDLRQNCTEPEACSLTKTSWQ